MMKKMLCEIVRYPAVAWILRELSPLLKISLGWLVVVLAASLLWVMFLTADGGLFAWLLGAKDKNETIKFIGLGMSGVLAVIIALALHRRATAQAESAAAMAENNKLIEKGHIDERLKAAVQSLGSGQSSVRIAAFYQFYNLAKGSTDADFVKNIFDILCAHLRQITSKENYRSGEGKDKPTEECQSLLDVLFKNQQNLFAEIAAQLRGVHLVGANLCNANLQKAVFFSADLRRADFREADLRKVFFASADLRATNFREADLREAWILAVKARKASFKDANMQGANLGGGSMHYADLHAAKNLDKAIFYVPVEINASDAEHYSDRFKKGTHYTVSNPE